MALDENPRDKPVCWKCGKPAKIEGVACDDCCRAYPREHVDMTGMGIFIIVTSFALGLLLGFVLGVMSP